jgi:hypothetical protein
VSAGTEEKTVVQMQAWVCSICSMHTSLCCNRAFKVLEQSRASAEVMVQYMSDIKAVAC